MGALCWFRQLEVDAAEIRMRAERRLGELIRAQKETVGLRGPQHSTGGGSKGSKREPLPDAPPTLAEAGIDKKLSSREISGYAPSEPQTPTTTPRTASSSTREAPNG